MNGILNIPIRTQDLFSVRHEVLNKGSESPVYVKVSNPEG